MTSPLPSETPAPSTPQRKKLRIDAENVLTWEAPKDGDPLMFGHLRRFAKEIIALLDEAPATPSSPETRAVVKIGHGLPNSGTPTELDNLLDDLRDAIIDERNNPTGSNRGEMSVRAAISALYFGQLKELERLKAAYSVCPNCNTSWTGGEMSSAITELESELERLKAEQLTPEEARDLRQFVVSGVGSVSDATLEKLWSQAVRSLSDQKND